MADEMGNKQSRGLRSVLGYFHDVDRATAAARDLRESGFLEVSVDRISPYSGDGIEGRINPSQGRMSGLGDLVLNADLGPADDSGILLAATTAASGQAADKERVRGHDVLVTVVVGDDAEAEHAAALLEKKGAMV